jgi:hypothetical protein
VLRGDDPEPVALHLWAVAHGMVSLELARHLPDAGHSDDGEARFVEALAYAGMPFLATL